MGIFKPTYEHRIEIIREFGHDKLQESLNQWFKKNAQHPLQKVHFTHVVDKQGVDTYVAYIHYKMEVKHMTDDFGPGM